MRPMELLPMFANHMASPKVVDRRWALWSRDGLLVPAALSGRGGSA